MHRVDFEVRYRFFGIEEGGRRTGPPLQGYRCDWSYAEDDITNAGVYMIWPEFQDADGTILPTGAPVLAAGNAMMHILSDNLKRKTHRHRLRVGTKGFFVEGRRKVAEAEVTRILGLNEDSGPAYIWSSP